jgi:ATP-dependent helicase HepA
MTGLFQWHCTTKHPEITAVIAGFARSHPTFTLDAHRLQGFFRWNLLPWRPFEMAENTVDDYLPGQRWVNHAELQLGLGTVLTAEPRTVTLLFDATGETRTYARHTAPLARVAFTVGDEVRSHAGVAFRVTAVHEEDGFLIYLGSDAAGQQLALPESQLDSHLQLNRPADRLFTGQVDRDSAFELRYQTLLKTNQLSHSDLRGLAGCRTSLIPHQLYIAHEVAGRHAPRVLLADEVGLGKTIEAGLILHQQLLTERARRVLIVVPESLLHQWLVEMLRRFNLSFSLYDEQRCAAIEEGSGQDNPFHAGQLVLCSLEFLLAQPLRHEQAVAGEWDLLVVDEAHHLQWSPDRVSPEYRLVEGLAQATRGVLLLTATPEQLGKASHFARLRLLDPDRFPDYDTFICETRGYEPVAHAIEALLEAQPPDTAAMDTLRETLAEGDNQALLDILQNRDAAEAERSAARLSLVEHLLDRHGTGRVLFRNTRAAVRGFPARELHTWPLPLPAAYADCLAAARAEATVEPAQQLCPELLYETTRSPGDPHWADIDPRVDWLGQQLKQCYPQKVLVIAAHAATALDLAATLQRRTGIHAAVFHEDASLIERDRAAAYFADMESGSQVLICSEIGSEGRNFQFAHHLVLFDLPLNPDLLEQRIGRLDRIGQSETIHLHAPFLADSPQVVMLHWYHEGLDALEHPCPAGHTVYVEVETELLGAIHQESDPEALVAATRELRTRLNAELQRGRDRLLEYNSCRPRVAAALRDRIAAADAEPGLPEYLERLFDTYGIETEPHSRHSHIIRPGDHMQSGDFPGLRPEGMTITYDRQTALANEDRQFLTWEHPLVRGAMEMILSNEPGNTAMCTLKYAGAKPGTLLLECLYTLYVIAGNRLQTGRHLPPTTLRIVTDQQGKDHGERLTHELIGRTRESIPPDTAMRVIRGYQQPLRDMLAASEQLAQRRAPDITATARLHLQQNLETEINRLQALRRVNPNVREEEITHLEQELAAGMRALDGASLRLDALRVLIVT